MDTIPPFLVGLHRPFNKELKTSKWVCMFVKDKEIKNSNINVEFFFWMLDVLPLQYKKEIPEDLNGIPSLSKISKINSILIGKSEEEKRTILHNAMQQETRNDIEKNIYSTYKAASYFVNMAKDKLNLIDKNNHLTKEGFDLARIKSTFFRCSPKEKDILSEKIIMADFLLIISLCMFKKLSVKYKLDDYSTYQHDFLLKYYNIKRFNFTSRSIGNFNTVRNYWITSLDIIDGRMNLKRKQIAYIKSSINLNSWYTELCHNFYLYSKNEFKNIRKIQHFTKVFCDIYDKLLLDGKDELGFISLYDIKELLKISDNNFEDNLRQFYENEKSNMKIFFKNLVNSIDRRKRFEVRGVPVFKIKLK